MKKILVLLLALVMSMAMLTACGTSGDTDAGNSGAEVNGLTAAKNYLYTMYKDSAEVTPTDFTRVGVVKINGVTYTVEWTASSETVKIVYGDDKMVTIDVDEANLACYFADSHHICSGCAHITCAYYCNFCCHFFVKEFCDLFVCTVFSTN